MRVSHAIVFVRDMQRSVAFYRDVVGLPLRFESPGWTEFATEGATLALHVSNGPNAVADRDSHHYPAGHYRPGIGVADINAFHKCMLENNVACVQEPIETFGAWIAQYLDPDGLPISISEDRH